MPPGLGPTRARAQPLSVALTVYDVLARNPHLFSFALFDFGGSCDEWNEWMDEFDNRRRICLEPTNY